MMGAFPMPQNSKGVRTSDILLDADHSRRIGGLGADQLLSRTPNRSRAIQGSRAAARSALRRTGKLSAHDMCVTEAKMGKKQNMETASHWPPIGMNTTIGK